MCAGVWPTLRQDPSATWGQGCAQPPGSSPSATVPHVVFFDSNNNFLKNLLMMIIIIIIIIIKIVIVIFSFTFQIKFVVVFQY
jgi:hypothetical protein